MYRKYITNSELEQLIVLFENYRKKRGKEPVPRSELRAFVVHILLKRSIVFFIECLEDGVVGFAVLIYGANHSTVNLVISYDLTDFYIEKNKEVILLDPEFLGQRTTFADILLKKIKSYLHCDCVTGWSKLSNYWIDANDENLNKTLLSHSSIDTFHNYYRFDFSSQGEVCAGESNPIELNPDVVIRAGEPDDHDQFNKLYEKFRKILLLSGELRDRSYRFTYYLLDLELNEDQKKVFVAEHKEKGLVGFVVLSSWLSVLDLKVCYVLNDLYVKEEYRNRGYGKLLVKKAFEFCRENQAASLSLYTKAKSAVNNRFYKKLGFVIDKQNNYYNGFYTPDYRGCTSDDFHQFSQYCDCYYCVYSKEDCYYCVYCFDYHFVVNGVKYDSIEE